MQKSKLFVELLQNCVARNGHCSLEMNNSLIVFGGADEEGKGQIVPYSLKTRKENIYQKLLFRTITKMGISSYK